MIQWIGALVPAYLFAWLAQVTSRKFRGVPLSVIAAHIISLILCIGLWSVGTYDAQNLQLGPRIIGGLVVYLPPQLVWFFLDRWSMDKPRTFFRGPSVGVIRKWKASQDLIATPAANKEL